MLSLARLQGYLNYSSWQARLSTIHGVNKYRHCRDGILGHQFKKRLKSFASSYSQSLLLADFKENHTLLSFLKILTKNPRNKKTQVYSIHEYHFVKQKNEDRKPDKNSSLRRLEFMPRNLN
jgi:hypothetical protein